MLLVLVLISTVAAVPLPEFNLQSGGRVVQREIPTFDGVDWSKSRRGVCYDKTSSKNVAMGQQFYLDCGRCTCDRYGFWCIPKCPLFKNPDLSNCEEVIDITDPCCPRKECLKYKDPTRGPTTDPWGKETMSVYNGIDELKEKTTTLQTESVTITVTLEEGEETTQSTTQFGGAFTTGSTKNAAGEVVTELGRETTETLTEVLTPASLPVTVSDDLQTTDFPEVTTTQGQATLENLNTPEGLATPDEIVTPEKPTTTKPITTTQEITTQEITTTVQDIETTKEITTTVQDIETTQEITTQEPTTPEEPTTSARIRESSEISEVPLFSTAAGESSTSEDRSLGYMTGTSDRTRSSSQSPDRSSNQGSDFIRTYPPRPVDDNPSKITNSIFTITAESSEAQSEVVSTGSPGPQSTSQSQKTSEEPAVTTGNTSEYPSIEPRSESTEYPTLPASENPTASSEEPSTSPQANTEIPSTSPEENLYNSKSEDRPTSPGITTAGPSVSTNNRSSSGSDPTEATTGTTGNISREKTENSSTRGRVRTEVLSTETMTMSSTEEPGIQSTPDYY